MNNKKTSDFSKLRRKIFFRAVTMLFLAIFFVWLLYKLVWQGRAGDAIVNFIYSRFGMQYVDAMRVYNLIFRHYDFLWWVLFIVIAFFVLFAVFLNWFTRYFNEVNQGIDALLDEKEDNIQLAPELSAVEDKLNTVRRTLRTRAADLQQEEQRKNDLVMYLAHDIKTPLTSVIGYLSLLDETPDMPMAQKAKYTHITLDKAYRLEELVNEFFEITRYNMQNIALQKEKVDLTYLLVQLVDEFYPLASEKGIVIALEAEEALTVSGDADKLARAFSNLLKNAIAYSFADSRIEVAASAGSGEVVVSVKNSGETIPKDKLKMIFGKFNRLDAARSTNTGGAGLGLAIAQEIVQLHDGTLTVESQDQCTKFILTLPA